jgi:hypothetical protein
MQIKTVVQPEDLELDFSSEYPDLPKEEVTLNVTYDPSVMTPNTEVSLRKTEENASVIVGMLLKMILKWDLMDGKKVVPLTEEALMDLPFEVLGLVITGISKHVQEKAEAEGKA